MLSFGSEKFLHHPQHRTLFACGEIKQVDEHGEEGRRRGGRKEKGRKEREGEEGRRRGGRKEKGRKEGKWEEKNVGI